MSKRKGITFEEKRKRLCDLFHESKDFYQLKELERQAPKLKGVVSQSVKEVIESLVADNMINCEKIGTSNYYWSFPNTSRIQKEEKIKLLKKEIKEQEKLQKELEKKIEKASSERVPSESREQNLEILKGETEKNEKFKKEIKKYEDCDPVIIEKKKKESEKAKEAANRWTDNIFILQSFCNNRFYVTQKDFCKNFNIPEDLDTID
ncbi:meiotic nuclear division protein 1 [Anaeromyces robustus]|uniref:Meiotic nuclear division protein 1 n=1 Tax=Anaeromyces robustus TaxID=1754192 RepID=A0A1Y1XQ56_9FUNG|nr:meiotic nuclear division protein 1 [Anaeromyces robustus]|eukprot:ORX87877.1 meiotic nuclear division protein 1 [Anaeromyces robustus]